MKRHWLFLASAAFLSSEVKAEDLPFVFQGVPQRAQSLSVFGGYSIAYGRRATPPLGPDGVEHLWFGGFHITEKISGRFLLALTTHERLEGQSVRAGGELRAVIVDKRRAGFDLGVSAGYIRELKEANLVTWALQASKEVGKVLIGTTAYFEKAFAPGRDAVDVIVTAGAAYRLSDSIGVALEYQGQDLEDLWEEEEAEGGARHLLGPSLTFSPFEGRVGLGIGAGFGLTRASPTAVGRAVFVATF